MEYKVIDAQPEDTRGISELLYKTWLATYPNKEYGITEDDIHDRYKDAFSETEIKRREKEAREMPKNMRRFVVKDSGKIIGFCRVILHKDKNQLQAIYVLPEYQGRGIGHALWLEAKKHFDPTKETIVQVAVYNAKAIAFYERLGFKDNGRRFSDERFRLKSGNMIPEMEMSLS